MLDLNLLIDKQPSHSLSGTNAHADQQHLLLCPPALAQSSNNLSCASSTQRVTQCDGTTTGVHLRVVEADDVVTAVHCHGGESLIDFDDVDVGEANVVLGEELGDGDTGTDTHDARGKAGDGRANILGHDRLAELYRGRSLHEENSGS